MPIEQKKSVGMKKIVFLGLASVFLVTGCSLKSNANAVKTITPDEAKIKAENYINANLMTGGNKVAIKDIAEEEGLYKIDVVLPNGQSITSYLTEDGTKFFPQALDTNQNLNTQNNNAQSDNAAPQQQSIPKTDRPNVELFVMAYCPYGTQMEKGILPVVDALKNKINFEIKFCDYSMHGEGEINEELRQVCIKKDAPDKYETYLKCFLKAGADQSDQCLKTAGIDKNKIDSCSAQVDKQYQVKAKFADKSRWPNGSFPPFDVYKADNEKYGVQGSPTLVINGVQANTNRDSESLLKTICSAFTKEPAECKTTLPSVTPSTGFGDGNATDSGSGANCATN